MKRLLLAGVSLTVTACSMPSATPPSTASLSTSRSASSQYLLSLAATPECTIWRDTAGARICLDSATPEAAQPVAAAPEPRRASRFEREPGQDFSDAAVFNRPAGKASDQAKPVPVPAAMAKAIKAAKPADPAMPEIAAAPKRPATLFEEMQRIGMLDAKLRVVGAPPRMAIAQADQAQIQGLPQLPTAAITTPPVVAPPGLPQLPQMAQGVISQTPARAVEQAFAADPAAAPPPRATKSAATAATPSAGWKPVDGSAEAGRTQIAASDNMGRAPVAPVERAELPSVRSDTVVPLKITEKATDQRPAVVAPASIAPTKIAANPGAAPDLPPLPNLPQLPGASAPTAQPVPVALSAPPPPPVAQPAAKPVSGPVAKPLSQPVSQPVSKPVSQPVSKPLAKPLAKPSPGKLARVAPSAAPVQPGGARYLVIHSFTDRQKAAQAAQKYGHLGATVATAQIQGQTWHRVVVRDGAAQRDRLNADGVRVYWPVSL